MHKSLCLRPKSVLYIQVNSTNLVDDQHWVSKLCVLQVMGDQDHNAVLKYSTHTSLEQLFPNNSVNSTQRIIQDVHIGSSVDGSGVIGWEVCVRVHLEQIHSGNGWPLPHDLCKCTFSINPPITQAQHMMEWVMLTDTDQNQPKEDGCELESELESDRNLI